MTVCLSFFQVFEKLQVCLKSDVSIPANITEAAIEFMFFPNNSNKPIEETGHTFLESLQLNTAQTNMMEKHTRRQQSNDEWPAKRCGHITSSKLHDVHRKTNSIIQKRGQKKIHYSPLVAQIIENSNISHENDAVKSFMARIKKL